MGVEGMGVIWARGWEDGLAIWWGYRVRICGICSEGDMGMRGIVGYGGGIWG